MDRNRLTVADLRSLKGKRQLVMVRVANLDEAAAAEQAGVDIVATPPNILTQPSFREVAPTVFSMTGISHLRAGTRDDYLRFCCRVMEAGADAVYCSGSPDTVAYAAREHIPVVAHIGLVPSRVTWTGGFKAVGRTASEAMALLQQCRTYEEAGAFAAEIEVVPPEVASAIAARSKLLLWSMGSGTGCDAQYLWADDILGTNRGHLPRHAKVYRNFAAEFDRLQAERVAAFAEFKADVASGSFPKESNLVRMREGELSAFLDDLRRLTN